jgi:uncharacterized RDD family membrane protein YckC
MTDQDDQSGQQGQPPPSPYTQGQPPPSPYTQGQPPPGPYGQDQRPPSPYGQGQYGQPPSPYGQGQYGQSPYGSSGIPAAPSGSYTDWPHRAGGYLLDVLPAFVITLIGVVTRNTLLIVLFELAALAYTIYNRWILGGQGQSLGKKALGIKLVGEETGQPIGTLMAFVRDICHVLDSLACYIGWLFPLWDAKRQTFADKIMRTVVVPA